MTVALMKIFTSNGLSIIESVTFRGGFFSTSWSTGSTPRLNFIFNRFMTLRINQTNLWAGGPSIIILIQRICIAFNGLGKWKTVESVIKLRAAILLWRNKIKQTYSLWKINHYVLNWNRTKFRILWKMALPSSIAALKTKNKSSIYISIQILHDRIKIVFNKNHISCFLGYVSSCLSHSNANISCFKSNCIINTITCHTNDMSLCL